jgi:hypothetical protein
MVVFCSLKTISDQDIVLEHMLRILPRTFPEGILEVRFQHQNRYPGPALSPAASAQLLLIVSPSPSLLHISNRHLLNNIINKLLLTRRRMSPFSYLLQLLPGMLHSRNKMETTESEINLTQSCLTF